MKRYELRWAALDSAEGSRAINESRLGCKLGTLSGPEARTLRRRLTEMYGE